MFPLILILSTKKRLPSLMRNETLASPVAVFLLTSGTTSTKAYPLLPNSSVRAVTVLSIASELYFSSTSTSINLLKSSALPPSRHLVTRASGRS